MSCVYLNNNKHIYLSDYNVIINRELQEHFLKHALHKKVKTLQKRIDTDYIRHQVGNLTQVIFQTTQDCNLKCKYCVYGGTYRYQRGLEPTKYLDFETARSGLDYIFDIIKHKYKKKFVISFYGGETLLNFDLIKKTVEYSKKKFLKPKPGFYMTTNLTILNNDILDFLVDNHFHLTVSLDGPKENHNAKRVFPNGKGSFDVVIRNLEKIKKRNEAYYKKEVGFETVFSRDLDIHKVYDFFCRDDLVNQNTVQFSFVEPYDTTYYERYPYDEEQADRDFKEIIDRVKHKTRNKKELLPIEQALSRNFKKIKKYLHIRNYSTTANTCLFDTKLFIDTDGRFHVCEKINDRFPFGDVRQGFDFDRMARILQEFCRLMQKKCSDCEFKLLCFRCFVPFAKDGTFEFDEDFCRDMKENVKHGLEKCIQYEMEGII